MKKAHALTYPAMSARGVALRLATEQGQLTPLMNDIANDFEARANLSPSFFSSVVVATDTWNEEHWLIEYKGELVGYVSIHFVRSRQNLCNLAVAVKRTHRDKGIGILALVLILRYMFDVLGVRKLETDCFGYNLRSIAMYSKYLTNEGERRESVYWAGTFWSQHLFGLTRDEWQECRPRLERLLGVKSAQTQTS